MNDKRCDEMEIQTVQVQTQTDGTNRQMVQTQMHKHWRCGDWRFDEVRAMLRQCYEGSGNKSWH